MTVAVLPPDKRLQRKIGGSARAMIKPAQMEAAESALRDAARQVGPMVLEALAASETLARQRPFCAPRQLYEHAHAIRGLAGMCGYPKLGRVAAAMCRLLENVEDGAAIDANLVTSIAVAMMHAAREPDRDPAMLDELIAACNEAVDQAKAPG